MSLFNLTAASQVLKYRETFLTIEFHKLDSTPERSYTGPYQGKYTMGPEVMESLVKLEGLTLSQMQSQFTELAANVERWGAFAGKIDQFLATMESYTRTIQSAITRPHVLSGQPPGARTLSTEDAAKEILELFKRKKRLYYSDIAEELQLDLGTVIGACEILQSRGLIEGGEDAETRT